MLQTLLFFIGFVWFPIELALASSFSSWSSTATTTPSSSDPKDNPLYSIRLPGQPFETSWEEAADEHDDEDRPIKSKGRSWLGAGREFNLFDSRGGSNEGGDGLNDEADALGGPSGVGSATTSSPTSPETATTSGGKYRRPSSPHPYASSSSSGGGGGNYFQRRSSPARQRAFSFSSDQSKTNRRKKPELFQTVQDWWTTSISPNVQSWPKIQCRVEPTTTLKIRKTFRPLKTIVRLGADFNTQRGVWQFKSSWEDDIIGGKLTLAGKELQLTKSWQLSVGKYYQKS
jgi:hypothetical protein